VQLDESNPNCQGIFGLIHRLRGSHELAEHHYLRAIELNRNSSSMLAGLGSLYAYLGKPAEGVKYLEEAKRLDPFFDPSWYWPALGGAYFIERRYDDAIAALGRSPTMPYWARAYMAACYAFTDRGDQARDCAAAVLRLQPNFSLVRFAVKESFKRRGRPSASARRPAQGRHARVGRPPSHPRRRLVPMLSMPKGRVGRHRLSQSRSTGPWPRDGACRTACDWPRPIFRW
jgi:tetratricopeptide (TPR) repeat protein